MRDNLEAEVVADAIRDERRAAPTRGGVIHYPDRGSQVDSTGRRKTARSAARRPQARRPRWERTSDRKQMHKRKTRGRSAQ